MVVSSIIVNLKFLLWQIYPIQFNSITWELAKSWQNNERRKGFSLTTCSCRREKASSGLENSEKLRSKRNDWRACWQRLWQKPAKGLPLSTAVVRFSSALTPSPSPQELCNNVADHARPYWTHCRMVYSHIHVMDTRPTPRSLLALTPIIYYLLQSTVTEICSASHFMFLCGYFLWLLFRLWPWEEVSTDTWLLGIQTDKQTNKPSAKSPAVKKRVKR